MLAFTFDTD